jgi:hypothetical protein
MKIENYLLNVSILDKTVHEYEFESSAGIIVGKNGKIQKYIWNVIKLEGSFLG